MSSARPAASFAVSVDDVALAKGVVGANRRRREAAEAGQRHERRFFLEPIDARAGVEHEFGDLVRFLRRRRAEKNSSMSMSIRGAAGNADLEEARADGRKRDRVLLGRAARDVHDFAEGLAVVARLDVRIRAAADRTAT